MKEKYMKPEIEVIRFDNSEDIITCSGDPYEHENHGNHYGWGDPQPGHGNDGGHGHNHGGHH